MLAGPGSGKTSVLISHIQQLITNGHARPEQILVVTFTRAAAAQMKERYLKDSGLPSTGITFGTLHGVFYAILRGTKKTSGKQLVAGEEKRRLLETLLEDLGQDREQRQEQARLLEQEISRAAHGVRPEDFVPESLEKEQFWQAYFAYRDALRQMNGMDFDDLAGEVERLFAEDEKVRRQWQQRFSHVLVDEFQDIDDGQYRLLKVLAAPQNNLFMVGDDDQSIYGFRGAAPEVMQQVPRDFEELSRVVLDVNYRCKSRIIACADGLIAKNSVRFEKKARAAVEEPGTVVTMPAKDKRKEWKLLARDIRQEIQGGRAPGNIAVLTRTNAGAKGILLTLWGQGIPCSGGGTPRKLSEHFIWKDVRAYLEIAAGEKDRRNYLKILNKPMRCLRRESFGETKVNWQRVYEAAQNPIDLARLKRFEEELGLLAGLAPAAALYCIRRYMGYEEYLTKLAARQHREVDELMAVLDILQQLAGGKRTLAEYAAAVEGFVWPVSEAGVRVCTLHASKGLEYEVVYIPDVNEGNIPWNGEKHPENVEEERRLLYVGMTRAKDKLCLLWTDGEEGNLAAPSRFLAEAGLIREEPMSIPGKRRI